MRELVIAFVVTETSRDMFLMHDLVRVHAQARAEAEMSEMEREAAARRLLRYYRASVETAGTLLRPGDAAPAATDGFDGPPITTRKEAVEWLDQEWSNLLAVVEASDDRDEEVVSLARLAAEFAEGTR